MQKQIRWILKKDFLAARTALAIALPVHFLIELGLARVWISSRGFVAQVAVWVFLVWVLSDRFSEDARKEDGTAWLSTRPVHRGHAAHAKAWFVTLVLLVPAFLIRFILSLSLNQGLANAVIVAFHGLLPLILLGLLMLMIYHFRGVTWYTVLTLCVIMTQGILYGLRTEPRLMLERAPSLQAILPDTPAPHPSVMLDPWLAVELEPERILISSGFRTTLSVQSELYNLDVGVNGSWGTSYLNSQISAESWYWYFHRRYPMKNVHSDVMHPPLVHATTRRQEGQDDRGRKEYKWVNAKLPENLDGQSLEMEVRLAMKIGEGRPVWEGPISMEKSSVSRGIRVQASQGNNNNIVLEILGPITAGFTGASAYVNWFQAGAGVVLESMDGEDLLVFPASVQQEQSGMPAFSRRYRLTLYGANPFFEDNQTWNVSIHSAHAVFSGRVRKGVPLVMRIPREQVLTESLSAHVPGISLTKMAARFSPKVAMPNEVDQTRTSAPSEFGRQMDRHIGLRTIAHGPGTGHVNERQYPNHFWELRNVYDPSNPEHIHAILHRLHWQPYLFDWLPEADREEGRQRLKESLRQRPVLNPKAMLQLAEKDAFEDEESLRGLAWCFIYSNRLDYLRSEGGTHRIVWAPRYPVRALDLFPKPLRDEVWEKTWPRVAQEILADVRIAVSPDYLLEALRRDSPRALQVSAVYFRRIDRLWISRYGHHQEFLEELMALLIEKTRYSGDPEGFVEWFQVHGIARFAEK
ncbi:MAG: hypothetical protein JJU29_21455 [Verrucomicrobia bacterium]|nr:hypothetical protein [Verrucomicrobiota bacterium]MCH8514333.1 hypothetical protein [Kiritimatiellia bacterium]